MKRPSGDPCLVAGAILVPNRHRLYTRGWGGPGPLPPPSSCTNALPPSRAVAQRRGYAQFGRCQKEEVQIGNQKQKELYTPLRALYARPDGHCV